MRDLRLQYRVPKEGGLEVRWQGFRGFRDTGLVELHPVTILLGANNTGKTSFLAPLLALKQTLNSKDFAQAIKVKGELIDVGHYREFSHNHECEDVVLTLVFHSHTDDKSKRAQIGRQPGAVDLTFSHDSNGQEIRLKRFQVRDLIGRPILRRTLRKNGYTLEYLDSRQPRSVSKATRKAIRSAKPNHFLFDTSPVFRAMVGAGEGAKEAPQADFNVRSEAMRYMVIVQEVAGSVRGLLDGISYIGPLRRAPRRSYELMGEMPRHVGTDGAQAPELLFRKRRDPLTAQVNEWVKRFGLGSSFGLNELTNDIFEVVLRRQKEKSINIADTGFGVSQLLPILVQIAKSSKGDTIIIEQPEIHLNPKQQTMLGELFVDAAQDGKRIVVETHSEHLVLSVRRLVAAGKLKSSDLGIYYVSREGNESRLRKIPVNAKGHIQPDQWPSGFFDDALRESLALALEQAKP